MKRLFLLCSLLLLLSGCGCFLRIVEMGNGFALTEYDYEDISIMHTLDGAESCYSSPNSCDVIPPKVLEYSYDDRWIIAKSKLEDQSIVYWIIDKECKYNRIEQREQLKQQTIGPLNVDEFRKEMKDRNINLILKPASDEYK